MKFVEKIKNNWKKIVVSAGILGCGILLGGYMCKKNLEKTEDNNNYNNNNNNYNNKHYKHNNNYKHNRK